ncbi:MAG: GHMP kinase [Desulfitobacteriaceae bacterium]|nr:GHMP kinase [Desulfitobacteriaceae bacterium]MDI6879911.1 GHMP kinase [Desulfitobacteriaceae bacterium]MDI6915433.1 GHMP kinase [Desulfitobacteriaceae bacterium]
MLGIGWARCPGTCGEWVQGARAGVPFLVDSPIERFAEVFLELDLDASQWKIPFEKEKARQALSLLRQEYGFKGGGRVRFLESLPAGKGMASSTADIVASAAAFLRALGHTPTAEMLANLALTIEPSDSVMFPGITLLNHVQGGGYESLGPAVPAQFLALDWGGAVDTLAFNARQDLAGHYRRFEPEIALALALVKEGIAKRDLEKLAAGSSMSARCNQTINPKPYFETFAAWVQVNGGLGLITAHSGTLLAGIFPATENLDSLLSEVRERFSPNDSAILRARDGGVDSGSWDQRGGKEHAWR